ncbi:unnamed protein product [Prorocentrum cordatum]|uniref:Uncharacterized protein n=1 Tax=Prorocentrum cordatum TaxID=2364126 RepID=A0ABN9TRZ5_9DINO|nr:unnamed protein product [Polarella glacialis]
MDIIAALLDKESSRVQRLLGLFLKQRPHHSDISARRAANVEANVECTLRPWYDAHGPPTTEHERGMHAAAMLPKRALALAIPFLQLMHHG